MKGLFTLLLIVSGLEVSGSSENNFIELPNVFRIKNILVNENVPHQKHLKGRSHLKDVSIPIINAEEGLLIRANAHKAMEPWQAF